MDLNILIAMDSFKGSLTSLDAGRAAAEGVRQVFPDADVLVRPLADGGEGTVEALMECLGGTLSEIRVTGPLGTPVWAMYGVLPDHRTAVMEIAQAAGLSLVPEQMRNPLDTTTYGVGEMIRHAIRSGCRKFIIGLGGSATNDAGIGMLQALGIDCLDEYGMPVAPYGAGLGELRQIRTDQMEPCLPDCEFTIICDVTNPLCGPKGASAVFGPQKGADPEVIGIMDSWLGEYAKMTGGDPELPGSGAAGGLGYTFQTIFGAEPESGIVAVIRETGLEEAVRQADLVLTGEGRLDAQTAMGKAPAGIAGLAHSYGKPVIAFAGDVTEPGDLFDGVCCITPGDMDHRKAMEPQTARINLKEAVSEMLSRIEIDTTYA